MHIFGCLNKLIVTVIVTVTVTVTVIMTVTVTVSMTHAHVGVLTSGTMMYSEMKSTGASLRHAQSVASCIRKVNKTKAIWCTRRTCVAKLTCVQMYLCAECCKLRQVV